MQWAWRAFGRAVHGDTARRLQLRAVPHRRIPCSAPAPPHVSLPVLQRWPYAGLFVALFAEEAGVPLPVPGDLFIAGMGAAGRAGRASFLLTTGVVVCAAVGGSAVLFEISRRVGPPLLTRLGRRVGVGPDRVARVEHWLRRRGMVAVVVGRLIPGLRVVLTVVAGSLGLDRRVFLVGTAIAAALWSTIYYWLGYALGAGVTAAVRAAFGRALHDPDTIAIAVTGAALLGGTALATTLRAVWRRAQTGGPRR